MSERQQIGRKLVALLVIIKVTTHYAKIKDTATEHTINKGRGRPIAGASTCILSISSKYLQSEIM